MKKNILLSMVILTTIITKAQNPVWYPLGQGIDSVSYTIASHNDTLYISGPFNSAFGFTANNFALYVNGNGVNPGTGFTNGYANCFFNFNNAEYAGGAFNGYFLRFNPQTLTWDSVAPVTDTVIRIDTFQNNLVLATGSSVMLYDTATHLLSVLPKNFNGLLTGIAVFQNKIWMAAYNNHEDTISSLYTWDGAAIGDSTLLNAGIKFIYSDNNNLLISGKEIGGAQEDNVAIYSGGKFSDISDNWNYTLFNVGYVTNISGNLAAGYLFSGYFQVLEGDGNYHPVALYQNGNLSVLGNNLKGTAYGACFNADNTPVAIGSFTLSDTTGNYNVVVLGAAASSGIATINKGSNLLVYPNPFHSGFSVNNIGNNSIYRLYDELGRTVTTINATGNELVFNGEQLSAGVYLLKEISGTQNVIEVIKQ